MEQIIEDIAPKELVLALDANMIAFRSVYGRANGCALHATSDIIWFYTGVPNALYNGVLFAQLSPHEIKATVDRLQAKILQHGAPALWWLGPLSQPAHLGSLLEEYGLHPAGEIPGMAIELAIVQNHLEMPSGFSIQKVTTKDMQAVWAGIADSATDAMVQLEVSLNDPQYQAQHRYVGFLDGIPVARSVLALDAGAAGIYAVGTIPSARGKGIGRAMTMLPLLEARRLGYRVGILQASHMGYSLYQKIGFKEVCRYRLYVQSA